MNFFQCVQRNNLHPVRGRKHLIASAKFLLFLRNNSPPQGDGNPPNLINMSFDIGNNSHPARGRKQLLTGHKYQPPSKQPTPRKGTETLSRFTSSSYVSETTYTPQGDGNGHRLRSKAVHRQNNLHPARGRKLDSGLWLLKLWPLKQPTPRKGTETVPCYG